VGAAAEPGWRSTRSVALPVLHRVPLRPLIAEDVRRQGHGTDAVESTVEIFDRLKAQRPLAKLPRFTTSATSAGWPSCPTSKKQQCLATRTSWRASPARATKAGAPHLAFEMWIRVGSAIDLLRQQHLDQPHRPRRIRLRPHPRAPRKQPRRQHARVVEYSRSPACKNCGRSANIASISWPLAAVRPCSLFPASLFNTSMRLAPRTAGGCCAISSAGRSKWKSETSTEA